MECEISTLMVLMNAPQPTNDHNICNASVTIVDADVDSAEALQALIGALPGVASVRTAPTADAALALLAGDAEVYGYALPAGHIQQVVLLAFADVQGDAANATETIARLRAVSPDVAIVLLCVYPEHARGPICELADICLPKDTSPVELRALLHGLRGC